MSMNLEIERIGNTITCVSGVIHKLLESCTIEDKADVMTTVDAVCYITEYIEIQAEKLLEIGSKHYQNSDMEVTQNEHQRD